MLCRFPHYNLFIPIVHPIYGSINDWNMKKSFTNTVDTVQPHLQLMIMTNCSNLYKKNDLDWMTEKLISTSLLFSENKLNEISIYNPTQSTNV